MTDFSHRPPGWHDFPIWEHIDQMWGNIQASHVHLAPARRRLEAISAVFDEITKDWSNPEHRIGAMLFIRTLSAFRVSVALSMCSPVEMYPVLRLCIECAGYAHLMAKDPTLESVWLRRSEGGEQAKNCRKAFTPENIKASLEASAPELKRIYTQLYDNTIMLGAHPNELSVTSALNIRHSDDGDTRFEEIVMLPGAGHALDVSMIIAARAGLCVLIIFEHVFPKRYADLKVKTRITALRQGL